MAPLRRTVLLAVLVGLVTAAAACGGDDAARSDGRLRVVATTRILAEFSERVAGSDAEVQTIVPAGTDVHGFAPSPSAARRIAEADLLIVNGYNLEETLLDLVFANRRAETPVVVAAGTGVTTADDADTEALARAVGDPHYWLDVPNSRRYVERIRDALIDLDVANADGYRARAETYLAELRALDDELRESLAVIPAERRRLVVFHDAYSFFADAYGFELTASLLPSGVNAEASASDVARIIELVRELGITTVFREPQFEAKALDAIAEETGAAVGVLYSTPTDDVATYADLMRANARALVQGLGSK